MAGVPRGGSASMVVALLLAGCGGGPAPNDVSAGAGLADMQSFEARRAALLGDATAPATMPTVISPLAADSAARPRGTASTSSAMPPAPVPNVVRLATAAVAPADAPPPATTPDRPDARSLVHRAGERRYSRSPLAPEQHAQACIDFGQDELAQQWFLQNGGPGRDRRGLDPDGDGYACGWNPAAARAALN